jgi:hypothetical protein
MACIELKFFGARENGEFQMAEMKKARNPLMPWYLGVVIIALADIWVARELFSSACQAPGIIAAGVVVVIPAVYLVLMYLTLRSQD